VVGVAFGVAVLVAVVLWAYVLVAFAVVEVVLSEPYPAEAVLLVMTALLLLSATEAL